MSRNITPLARILAKPLLGLSDRQRSKAKRALNYSWRVDADPDLCGWLLQANIQSRGRQLRHSLPIVASTQIFLGDEAVNRA